MTDAVNAPVELRQARDALSLVWPNSDVQRIAHAALRRACPCSACRSTRLAGGVIDVADDVTVRDIAPMGYGVQLVFSDGHDRGIFPWPWFEAFSANG